MNDPLDDNDQEITDSASESEVPSVSGEEQPEAGEQPARPRGQESAAQLESLFAEAVSSGELPQIPTGPGEDQSLAVNLANAPLNDLRWLLLAPEQEQLAEIKRGLDDPGELAQRISGVLPEALILRSGQDDRLVAALAPTIEATFKETVEADPQYLVDLISPVMAPSIRKAIVESIRGMFDSFNRALETSLSWRGIRWRLESLRTGRPFAEIVMMHNLVYQVEQVFLIHKETGLLLQHLESEAAVAKDADMVSSMLTAIQDFVRDSFSIDAGEALETMQVGEFGVWVEQGSAAVLAAAIRGNPPQTLRTTLREELDLIHLEHRKQLTSFDGDTAHFETVRPNLQRCLASQFTPEKRKTSPVTILALLAIIACFGYGGWLYLQHQLRWTRFYDLLRAEPGYVLTSVDEAGGKVFLEGFRDPLAGDLSPLLNDTGIDPDRIVEHWLPYYALHPKFILHRARHRLNPPDTVQLTFDKGVLRAGGSAPHRWIAAADQIAGLIPGVELWDRRGLADSDHEQLPDVIAAIEQTVLLFEVKLTDLVPGQETVLAELTQHMRSLLELSQNLDLDVSVAVTGHTDDTGSERTNYPLSRQRADQIATMLRAQGLQWLNFVAAGAGAEQPVSSPSPELARAYNRSVTFAVSVSSRNQMGGSPQ